MSSTKEESRRGGPTATAQSSNRIKDTVIMPVGAPRVKRLSNNKEKSLHQGKRTNVVPLAARQLKNALKRVADSFDSLGGKLDTQETLGSEIPKNRPYLIKGLLEQNTLAVVFGWGEAGKSIMTSDLAFALARADKETRWFGQRVKKAAVLIVACEDPEGVRNRVRHERSQHDEYAPLHVLDMTLDMGDAESWEAFAGVVAKLAAVYSDEGLPLLVIVDTVAKAGGSVETKDAAAMLARCERTAQEAQCAILFVAHTGKDQSRGVSGASNWYNDVYTQIYISRDGDESTAEVKKFKGGPHLKPQRFRIVPKIIGQDDDGDDITIATLAWLEGDCVARDRRGHVDAESALKEAIDSVRNQKGRTLEKDVRAAFDLTYSKSGAAEAGRKAWSRLKARRRFTLNDRGEIQL